MPECRGKHRFSDEHHAGRVLVRLWGKDASLEIGDLHVYPCPRCGKFHIGHVEYYEEVKKRKPDAR
jgi:hypothetical protein